MDIPEEIINDPRFTDIGDLPTGFAPYEKYGLKKIYIRSFTVGELPLIHHAALTKSTRSIIRVANMASSCDVNILTDGDFGYLLTWLRKTSYPESPLVFSWECRKVNIIEKESKKFVESDRVFTEQEMLLKNYTREVCGTSNTTIVYNVETSLYTLDDDNLYIKDDDVDFARVGTLVDYEDYIKEHPDDEHVASIARWVKAGDTFKEKMDILENSSVDLYERIVEVQKEFNHGVTESVTLACKSCSNKFQHTSKPKFSSFFADNTEIDVYNIQYSLMSEFGVPPDDTMPTKKFLYHYSCLAKDKKEERERHAAQKNAGRSKTNYNVNR